MESTSSPSASSSQVWNHDVYISFRGKDTRYNFVDHLDAAFQKRGICTYLDAESIPLGARIGPTLLKAVQESRVVIVVLSKHYAHSAFCLDELVHILRCKCETGQVVMPIFYHVDPLDVRKQKGTHGEAFANHELHNKDSVESWRCALKTVSELAGWEVNKDIHRRESTFIKNIVEEISNELLPDTGTVSRLQDKKLGVGDSAIMVPSRPSYCAPDSSSKVRAHSVFLSYREIDTGSNFVDHLYLALDQAEILTYMKEDTFPLDESFTPAHMKAIEESLIAVIIFSRNYATSWCLDELAYIMKCMDERGKIVIPIFYDVDASSVRKQTGEYGDAFARFKNFEETNKVESWKKALRDASELLGWELLDKHESKYIKLIVDSISKRLFPGKGFIGAQTRLEGLGNGGGGDGMANFRLSREELECLKIPLQNIRLATYNFSEEKRIARGGYGEVYRGQTEQLGIIAVKRLTSSNSGQGDREYQTEIELLSTYKHENIVSLVGCCDEGSERILVYRYEKNGSLDKLLHRKDLTWIRRLKVCLDTARALEYLHDDVQHHYIIVHRDIKSSNILLDETWKAKISDFGLSRIYPASVHSVIRTSACGTWGYVDPLFRDNKMLTQKSDVYSFGIVMLEVLFGRLVTVDPKYPTDRYFLLSLAQDHYIKETLDEMIESILRSQMNSNSLVTFSSIAYQCLKKRKEERPTMSQVVDQLEKALDYQQGLSGYLHDVYISFRDRDTEGHIVDDIRAALDQEGISTYKDDVTQSRKESILLKAIERSRLFVIVFTKKFAVNSWYLDEVAKITECSKEKGQFILPIFYNVSSSDIRTQKGYFGEVMSEYDTHPRMEVWRKALVEATIAAGLEYCRFWCNADLVKKIVEEIKSGLSEYDKKSANVLDEVPKQPTE